jgi:hypothetical protein
MPIFEYEVYDPDGNSVGYWENIFKSAAEAPEQMLFEDGYTGKKQISVIARTLGKWVSTDSYDPTLKTVVKNENHRDQLLKQKGWARPEDFNNKHLAQDMFDKQVERNAYWDKRNEEFASLCEGYKKQGFDNATCEAKAAVDWGTRDKLAQDKKYHKPFTPKGGL